MTYRQLRDALKKIRQLERDLDEAEQMRDQLKHIGMAQPAVHDNAERRVARCNDAFDQEIP